MNLVSLLTIEDLEKQAKAPVDFEKCKRIVEIANWFCRLARDPSIFPVVATVLNYVDEAIELKYPDA